MNFYSARDTYWKLEYSKRVQYKQVLRIICDTNEYNLISNLLTVHSDIVHFEI